MLPGFPLAVLSEAAETLVASMTAGTKSTAIGYFAGAAAVGSISASWVAGHITNSVYGTTNLIRIEFEGNAMALLGNITTLRINGTSYSNGGTGLFSFDGVTTVANIPTANPFVSGQTYTLELDFA